MKLEKEENKKYISCKICKAVNECDPENQIYCRRCGCKIYESKNRHFQLSLAFLITAMILYIPANIFPILKTYTLGVESDNTIFGGVVSLWKHGSYPIAIIVFLASIVIPIIKFAILSILLFWKRLKLKISFLTKHKLYILAEIIGPWSMIDVFVVAILSALIHFNIAKIKPGVATTSFALSVIFTMLSAISFDKRILE